MTAAQIVESSGMSARPEYYSGRGATTSDVNYAILTKIANKINTYIGKEAKTNFVKMVADIPKLTATDFLLTLFRLENNNWTWNKESMLPTSAGIHLESYDDALGTILSVLGGMNKTDETGAIRNSFLWDNGIKTESAGRANAESGYYSNR